MSGVNLIVLGTGPSGPKYWLSEIRITTFPHISFTGHAAISPSSNVALVGTFSGIPSKPNDPYQRGARALLSKNGELLSYSGFATSSIVFAGANSASFLNDTDFVFSGTVRNNTGTYGFNYYNATQALTIGGDVASVKVDAASNVYSLRNLSASGTNYYQNWALVKQNSSGTILWQTNTNQTDINNQLNGGFNFAIHTDGSFSVMATKSSNFSGDLLYGRLWKLSSTSSFVWGREWTNGNIKFGGQQNTVIDASGNVYCSFGSTATGGSGGYDCYLFKFNSSGTIQWQRRLGGAADDGLNGCALDSLGNIYVGGFSDSSSPRAAILAKYSPDGTLQWQRKITSANGVTGHSVMVDLNDNITFVTTSNNRTIVWRLPNDGSLTGTYGDYTYGAGTLTAGTPNITISNVSYTFANPNLTTSGVPFAGASLTLTATVTKL